MSESRDKTIALVVTTLSAFLPSFISSAVNLALPAIGRDFALNALLLNWVATSYILAAAAFVLPMGRIGDMYGRKRVFLSGLALYTAASFLTPFAPTVGLLLILRVLQGGGGAMIFGTAIAILTAVFPAAERGKVLGINVASTYIGLSSGPVLGGFLTQHYGWQSIFWLNGAIGLLILLMALWQLHGEWVGAPGETFDWLGSLLSIGMLVALLLGFSRLPAPLGFALLGASLLLFSGFVWWEQQTAFPMLQLTLFQNRSFAFSNLAALINYSATFAISYLMSLYLQYIKGLEPQYAGLLLVTQPLMMAIFSPLAGKLSDRVEPRLLASAGMSVIVVGLGLLSLLQPATPLVVIVVILLGVGIGFALFSSPNTNAIMSSVEKPFYGIAAATLAAMRSTGQSLSFGIVMLTFTLYIGNVKITPAEYPAFLISMKLAFSIFATLCLGGIFASLIRGKIR